MRGFIFIALLRGITFDMNGSSKQTESEGGCPLDGRVECHDATVFNNAIHFRRATIRCSVFPEEALTICSSNSIDASDKPSVTNDG